MEVRHISSKHVLVLYIHLSPCVAAGDKIAQIHDKPITHSNKADNLQQCVSHLDRKGIDVQGLSAQGTADVHAVRVSVNVDKNEWKGLLYFEWIV